MIKSINEIDKRYIREASLEELQKNIITMIKSAKTKESLCWALIMLGDDIQRRLELPKKVRKVRKIKWW